MPRKGDKNDPGKALHLRLLAVEWLTGDKINPHARLLKFEGARPTAIPEIAQVLGVSERSVRRWKALYVRSGGDKHALDSRRPPGRTPRLTQVQLGQLKRLLDKEPFWTAPRFVRLVKETFGIRFQRRQAGRILDGLGWAVRKPPRGSGRYVDQDHRRHWVRKRRPES